jgi:L-fucose dehydrogenase
MVACARQFLATGNCLLATDCPLMDLHLSNHVILVSGGAKGIGEAISRVLAAEGAIPVIIGRNRDDNDAAVARITAADGITFVKKSLEEPINTRNTKKSIISPFPKTSWRNF